MRILYGVCANGRGHLTRSGVIIQHLLSEGHDVRIGTSAAGVPYMNALFPGRVERIVGRDLVVERNKIRPVKTVVKNLLSTLLLGDWNKIKSLKMLVAFKPELIISDFDPWSSQYAEIFDLPLFSIDNNHATIACAHDPALIASDAGAYRNNKVITTVVAPFAERYIIMSFFDRPLVLPKASLHKPIVRAEIEKAATETKDRGHVTVYTGNMNAYEVLDALKGVQIPLHVYGVKGLKQPVTWGAFTFFPYSDQVFVEDLKDSMAVVAGGGFSLISEALALKKPMLSIPIKGHFEQVMNAHYLDAMGLGMKGDALNTKTLVDFMKNIDKYKENLAKQPKQNNQQTLAVISKAVANAPSTPRQIDYALIS